MSHRTLPDGDWTSSARWPIEVGGCAPTPITPGPSGLVTPLCPASRNSASVVHCCPSQPTYWRSSSQIGQSSRWAPYCTPQVRQIGRSVDMYLGIPRAG